jgi:hypothetical protein
MTKIAATPRTGPDSRFRPRRLQNANGELLVLAGNGTLERRDANGVMLQRWSPEDAGWADQAIRLGLHASPTTVAPSGRFVPDSKPAA